MAAVFFRGNVKFFHFLSGYVKFTSGYRSVSYDIGQPTSYSHPHLLKDGEGTIDANPLIVGNLICNCSNSKNHQSRIC